MQLVQYINLVRSDEDGGGNSHGSSYETSNGRRFPWIPADDFENDYAAGHGTHVAGSAVGSTLTSTPDLVTCTGDKVMGCVGGCIEEDALSDDLVSSSLQFAQQADLDRLCPAFDCDGQGDEVCLGDDVQATLHEHGGAARGAKLSVFDVFFGDYAFGTIMAGNGMWEPSYDIGGRIHSNSWGGDYDCRLSPVDILYDDYMYRVSARRVVRHRLLQPCPGR